MAILLQQASQSHGSLICRDEFTKVNLFLLVGPACSAGELFTLKQLLVNYYLEKKGIFSKIIHIEAEPSACGFGCNIYRLRSFTDVLA